MKNNSMVKIAVLLTVFNRREKTLKCLECLYSQLPLEGYEVDVFLTNDGCTDGTPEAVARQFPEVHIIQADGNLYWNRGMYTAWEKAAQTKDYDFYLWLNDDTYLLDDALKDILTDSAIMHDKVIIAAAIRSEKTKCTTYSGFYKQKMINPNGHLQICETFNGNCVLIPFYIYKSIGNLDWKFRHAIGDLDYGYRTRKNGFDIYCSSKYLGTCELNSKLPLWARSEIPFLKRIRNLYSPLAYAEPISYFYFEKRTFGLFVALKHFISIHIRVLFPQLWQQ